MAPYIYICGLCPQFPLPYFLGVSRAIEVSLVLMRPLSEVGGQSVEGFRMQLVTKETKVRGLELWVPSLLLLMGRRLGIEFITHG